MERTAVADMADRHCSKLSKGYRQRVGLAQALLHNPEVLILDEPTAGLDPKQIIETRQLIKDLGGDHTVILSSHILSEVSQTCQRVVIINKGRVVAVDTPDNLTSRLRGEETMYLQVDARGADVKPALEAIPGVMHVSPSDVRGDLISFEIGQRDRAGRAARARVGDRGAGMGTARAAAAQNEPRGDLPRVDEKEEPAAAPDGEAAATDATPAEETAHE